MSTQTTDQIYLDPELQARLEELASRNGCSVQELAEIVLRAHADTAEDSQTCKQIAEATANLAEMTTFERFHRHFIGVDITGFELPERTPGREPPDFT